MSATIENILSNIFGIDPNKLTDSHSPDLIEQWDSMNHLKLVTAIEENFEIKLTMKEIQAMLSVGAIKNIVEKHGNRE